MQIILQREYPSINMHDWVQNMIMKNAIKNWKNCYFRKMIYFNGKTSELWVVTAGKLYVLSEFLKKSWRTMSEHGFLSPNPALFELENLKKRPGLAHELGAGAACSNCKDKCPGFQLHFWRYVSPLSFSISGGRPPLLCSISEGKSPLYYAPFLLPYPLPPPVYYTTLQKKFV